MKVLVLGGTAWLGFEIAKIAAARGHEVTCMARGVEVPPGAKLIRADRNNDDALKPLEGKHWHAVIDVARQPIHVRRSVRDLRDAADRYIFVSTGNVYASQKELGADEDAPRLPPLASELMASQDDYGPAKVSCENDVLGGFGAGRSVIARVGLIGGPGDPSERTTYWVRRFANPANDAGAVLVPDAPELPVAMIDVRDLAAWLVHLAAEQAHGIFNAVGMPLSLPDHLQITQSVTGHLGPVVAAPEQWLLGQGVSEWSGKQSLPLWLVDHDWYDMNARSNMRAVNAGLRLRPLEETLADILAAEPALKPGAVPRSGLDNATEAALLAALR